MLDEVTLPAQEEIFHRTQMVLQMELLLEHLDQNPTDLGMRLPQPIIENSPEQTIAPPCLREFGLEVVDHLASVPQEVNSLPSYKYLLGTLDIQHIWHLLQDQLKTLVPFLTLRDPLVLSYKELSLRIQ